MLVITVMGDKEQKMNGNDLVILQSTNEKFVKYVDENQDYYNCRCDVMPRKACIYVYSSALFYLMNELTSYFNNVQNEPVVFDVESL